jgi:hypothetical protein
MGRKKDVGVKTFGRALRVLGVNVEQDSTDSRGFSVKKPFIIFVNISSLRDPLVQLGRTALLNDIPHPVVGCARTVKPCGGLTVPYISYRQGVKKGVNFREQYVDLAGLVIGFPLADVSPPGKFSDLPPPGEVGIFADVE